MIIDSHCHLDYEPIFSNLEVIINRAKDSNVKYMLTISLGLSVHLFITLPIIIILFLHLSSTRPWRPTPTGRRGSSSSWFVHLRPYESIKYLSPSIELLNTVCKSMQWPRLSSLRALGCRYGHISIGNSNNAATTRPCLTGGSARASEASRGEGLVG